MKGVRHIPKEKVKRKLRRYFVLGVFCGAILGFGAGVVYSGGIDVDVTGALDNLTSSDGDRVQRTAVVDNEFDAELVERYVLEYTNERRMQHNRNPVEWSERVARPARQHARHMAEHEYVAHDQPGGTTATERYSDVCDYSDAPYLFGENAGGSGYKIDLRTEHSGVIHTSNEEEVAKELVDGWMHSDDHRHNMLHSYWEELGVGVAKTDEDIVYAAQTFC